MKKFCLFIALVLLFPAFAYAVTVETLTSDRAATGFNVFGQGDAGSLKVAYGTYTITESTDLEAGDTFNMCKLPKGAVVVFGWLHGYDLDGHGTETLDLDVGWATNGTESADPDGFLNTGTMNGDAVTNYKPETGQSYPFGGVIMTSGYKKFTDNTTVTLRVNTAPAGFSTGTIAVKVFYVMEP